MSPNQSPPILAPGDVRNPIVVSARELALCSTNAARELLEHKHAERLAVLPLGIYSTRGRTIVSFAFGGGNAVELSKELRFLIGSEVTLTMVPSEPLDEAIHIAYHGDDKRLERALTAIPPQIRVGELGVDFRSASGDAANLLTVLVDLAAARGASDIHLVPVSSGSIIRLRINGELLTQRDPPCPAGVHSQIVSRVKVLSNLDTTIHNKPQDGAFQITAGRRSISLRITVMPTIHGESLSLRLLPNQRVSDLQQLGFDSECRTMISSAIGSVDGLILFVGPTGSGKTSSMYACVKALAERSLHVVTIEEPVEIQYDGATQVALNSRNGFDYAAALRGVLRQDPDVILIGEIRDRESAVIAYEAALTGHLLLGTVHARNATETLTRLDSLGVCSKRAAEVLRMVVHQRLLPKLCSRCKVIDLIGSREFGERVYQSVGCDACGYSGFDGRVVIPEILRLDSALLSLCEYSELSAKVVRDNVNSRNYRALSLSLEIALRQGSISVKSFGEFMSQDL